MNFRPPCQNHDYATNRAGAVSSTRAPVYGKGGPGSPESLARGMLPRGFPRNPRELLISSHTERNASHIGRYVTPRETGGTRRDAEQSYEPIVPTRAGNRRASARKAATVPTGGKGE